MAGALLACGAGGAPGVIDTTTITVGADCQIKWDNDGNFYLDLGGGFVDARDWVTPATAVIAAQYQIKVDATSGSFSAGTTGTWLDLSSDQTWAATSAVTFTWSIREKATGLVRATKTGNTIGA